MGADFVLAVCPLPSGVDGRSVRDEINNRLNNISEATVDYLLESYHHDWEGEVEDVMENHLEEDHLFKVNDLKITLKKEMAQRILQEALDEVIYQHSNRRDVGTIMIEGKWWIASGGMSWGDAPTEAMYYIEMLEESEILSNLN